MTVKEKIKEIRDHRMKGPMSPEEAEQRGYTPYPDKKMRMRDSALYPFKISGYFGDYPLTAKEQKAYEEHLAEEKREKEEGKRAWKEKKARDPPRAGLR